MKFLDTKYMILLPNVNYTHPNQFSTLIAQKERKKETNLNTTCTFAGDRRRCRSTSWNSRIFIFDDVVQWLLLLG
uniref:Uncharacterized protein n=1 Tax=Helianthus annuus TaxID=4232 RepID=A0A251SVG6_HELAN